MKRFVLITALFAFSLLGTHTPAGATGNFNQFIGFGDSTLDSGYFRYASSGNPAVDAALLSAIAAGAQGGFAGPGVMTSTMLVR